MSFTLSNVIKLEVRLIFYLTQPSIYLLKLINFVDV